MSEGVAGFGGGGEGDDGKHSGRPSMDGLERGKVEG